MKVYSIEWHRTCVSNMQSTLSQLKRDREQADRAISDLESRIALRNEQIIKAIALGKSEFDMERFCVKRDRKLARSSA